MESLVLLFILSYLSMGGCYILDDGEDRDAVDGNKDHVIAENDDRTIVESGIRVIEKCNGFMELCDLDITQVTLAGTHNSGAGFSGPLKYHTVMGQIPAGNCGNRFQQKSIYDQLVLGIRYFDIKACWVDEYAPIGAWVCSGKAFAGSIETLLKEIDLWMNEAYNRNEVVVLQFKGNSKHAFKTMTGASIIRQMKEKWEPSDSRNSLRKLAIQPAIEVKLGDAIRYNQRIYVIMHNELVLGNRESWIIPHWKVGETKTDMKFIESKGCYNLLEEMAENRCQKEAAHTFVRYDLYLKSGLCRKHLAAYCRNFLTSGLSRCFIGTSTRRRTVNFVVVDYANEDVVRAARKQNVENIQFFLHKNVQSAPNGNLCNVLSRLTGMGVPVYLGNRLLQI